MLGTCLLSTPWFSVLVSFDLSESESGKELRLGGGSLERESFVCKHEDLVQILGVHIKDGCS